MLHFNPAELRAVVAEVRANQCALVLAKDDGVYLMPAVGERNATAVSAPGVCRRLSS